MKTAKAFSFVGHQSIYRVYLNAQTGYWFVSYQVGGIRKRHTLGVMTKVEADHAVKQLDLRSQPQPAATLGLVSSSVTWEQFQKLYLEFKEQQGKAPNTIARYTSGLAAFGRYLKKQSISAVDAISLIVLEGYGEFRTKREKCDIKTAYTDALVIKNALKWGSKVSRGLLRANPGLDWETPKPIKPKRRCYTAEEVTAMEQGVRDWLKPVVSALAWTGLRIGELINLRWADVDLEKRVLHVRVQEEWKPKGRRDRVVPLHPNVDSVIRAQPVGQYVFRGPRGGRIKETYALECLKADQEDLKMPLGDLHAFRRYFATTMMRAGVNVESVRQWGGWKSLDTMLRYLADVDVEESVKSMDQAVRNLASA